MGDLCFQLFAVSGRALAGPVLQSDNCKKIIIMRIIRARGKGKSGWQFQQQ